MFPIEHYKTIAFDCDGVIFDSNRVKTEAFYKAALPYGPAAAQALVEYHKARGGISRYQKFDFFLKNIVGKATVKEEELQSLLSAFADEVWQGLQRCRIATGLFELRDLAADSRWLVISGGDQDELRRLFKLRGIDRLFDGGIFGSPDSKDQILTREQRSRNICHPAVFLGDSTYDHQAAERAGLDFVFVSGWSEMIGWPEYVKYNDIKTICTLSEIAD